MSLVDRIANIINGKGLTFKKLERECGLGNGTIKRWESQSPRLDGLVKVSNYLHVSLDELVFGSSESTIPEPDLTELHDQQTLVCDGSALDNIEIDLVAMFRLLPLLIGRRSLTLFILSTNALLKRKRNLFTRHFPARAATKKTTPSAVVIPLLGSPDFLRPFGLVIIRLFAELKLT